MSENKKISNNVLSQINDKPDPVFLGSDYPYKAVGDTIMDLNSLESEDIYEIKCKACEISIRSQGKNILLAYDKLKVNGCLGCGNKDLVINLITMK